MKTILSTPLMIFAGTVFISPALAVPKASPAVVKPVLVTIDNFSFMPATLTITKGTQVTWINHDDVPHTVVSTDGRFKSHALDTGDKFSFTFRAKGTYAYFCSVHPMMTAKVIVR